MAFARFGSIIQVPLNLFGEMLPLASGRPSSSSRRCWSGSPPARLDSICQRNFPAWSRTGACSRGPAPPAARDPGTVSESPSANRVPVSATRVAADSNPDGRSPSAVGDQALTGPPGRHPALLDAFENEVNGTLQRLPVTPAADPGVFDLRRVNVQRGLVRHRDVRRTVSQGITDLCRG